MFRIKFISIFCVIGIILVSLRCSQKEDNPIRLIKSNVDIAGGSWRFMFTEFPPDSGCLVSIPALNDDVLNFGSFTIILRKDMPDTLLIKDADSLLYINNTLSAIRIGNNHPSEFYLESLTDETIKNLKSIDIKKLIEFQRPSLVRIAKLKPDIDIVLEDTLNNGNQSLSWLLKYFKPKSLIIEFEIDSLTINYIATLSNLETLLLTFPDSGSIKGLPELKSVKNLYLYLEDSEQLEPNFLSKNNQLERLFIIAFSLTNTQPPPWQDLYNLKELNVLLDTLPNYSFAKYNPKLEVLSITYSDYMQLSSLTNLKNVKWLKIETIEEPDSTFSIDTLCNYFPTVEMLGIYNSDSLQNYAPLLKLPKLKYLMLFGETGLDTTLYNLKGLKYLSLPAYSKEDSVRYNALQEALPNTFITPNDGACMGSGWLLMLLPLSGVWFFLQQRHHKKTAYKRHV